MHDKLILQTNGKFPQTLAVGLELEGMCVLVQCQPKIEMGRLTLKQAMIVHASMFSCRKRPKIGLVANGWSGKTYAKACQTTKCKEENIVGVC